MPLIVVERIGVRKVEYDTKIYHEEVTKAIRFWTIISHVLTRYIQLNKSSQGRREEAEEGRGSRGGCGSGFVGNMYVCMSNFIS